MTDLWSERAELYRQSAAHREGPDLDLLVEWSRGARTALDVAKGGGPVARRLRKAGIDGVPSDSAPWGTPPRSSVRGTPDPRRSGGSTDSCARMP